MMERLSVDSRIPVPGIILLDLNMPRLDGRQALRLVKSDARLRKIPIVVLSTSKDLLDISSSYENGANSFFSKPANFSELVGLVGLLRDYWFNGVELPQ
jgi:two-component system response regulator